MLKQYAKAVPDTPLARAFSELERERSAGRQRPAGIAWPRPGARGNKRYHAKVPRVRLEETSKFLAENPRHPDAEQVTAYQSTSRPMPAATSRPTPPNAACCNSFPMSWFRIGLGC